MKTKVLALSARWPHQTRKIASFYGDGPPHWTEGLQALPPPSAEDARELSELRVERLRHYASTTRLRDLANALERCRPGKRCLSGACPQCVRAAQRMIVALAAAHIKKSGRNWHLVSLVPADATYPAGKLTGEAIQQFRRRMLKLVSKHRVRQALLGTDISANEHREGAFLPFWQLQAWVAIPSLEWARADAGIRNTLTPTALVRRPVKAQQYNGQLAGLAYLFKRDFVRRVTYTQVREDRRSGRCVNTRDRFLRTAQKLELYMALHNAGLLARLGLIGIDLPS